MTGDSKFKVVDYTNFSLGEGLLVVPIVNEVSDTSQTLYLEKVSLEIWNMLINMKTISEITKKIAELYEAEFETIEKDVYQFIDKLVREGYVSEY